MYWQHSKFDFHKGARAHQTPCINHHFRIVPLFGMVVPGRPVASGGAGAVFGRTVNPISTRGADYAHHFTTPPTPRFSDICLPCIQYICTPPYTVNTLSCVQCMCSKLRITCIPYFPMFNIQHYVFCMHNSMV